MKPSLKPWMRLIAACAVIATIWLRLLPLVGDVPAVSDHITQQQRRRIDPSAMYYTDLEFATDVAHHIERLNDTYADEMWNSSSFHRERVK